MVEPKHPLAYGVVVAKLCQADDILNDASVSSHALGDDIWRSIWKIRTDIANAVQLVMERAAKRE